jgi:hypothetical protein
MENNTYFLTQSEMETLKKVVDLLESSPEKAEQVSKTMNDGEVNYAFITGYLGAVMKEAAGVLKQITNQGGEK